MKRRALAERHYAKGQPHQDRMNELLGEKAFTEVSQTLEEQSPLGMKFRDSLRGNH
jgi:hypothetical protein